VILFVSSYKIEDLKGTLLYDEMELGTVDYLVDKEELLPALREAIKLLSINEVATFLFPSYLCYGYQGDGEKVDINQALHFTIKLTSHSVKN
jgi:FKBP-type peptidyl-prolyl cis-trans isomerase